jgi:hypothetical protein
VHILATDWLNEKCNFVAVGHNIHCLVSYLLDGSKKIVWQMWAAIAASVF